MLHTQSFTTWSWWYHHLMTTTSFLSLPIFILSLTLLSYFRPVDKSRRTTAKLPPGPWGMPIVGYLPFLKPNLPKQFMDLAETYGPIFRLRLGSRLCVVISSTSLVKEVVRDQDTVLANRDPPIVALVATYGGKDIAFSPYGPYWTKLRKVFARDMVSNSSLEASYQLRRKEVKEGIKHLYTKINTPIDVKESGVSIMLKVMMNLLWGETPKGKESKEFAAEFKKVVTELMELLGEPNVSDYIPVLARFDLQGIEKRITRVSQWFDNVYQSAIDGCKSSSVAEDVGKLKKGLVQVLLELERNEDGSTLVSVTEIKALLMDIVVGGTDTITTMVEWGMAELMNQPHIMKKVHDEIDKVVGRNNTLEEHHLSKLDYFDCVVKETLRLHPAFPLLVPHFASQTTTIGGYVIPKDTRVFLNVWGIHRDAQLWDDPLKFVPERFINGSETFDFSGNNFQYLPFGSGRRICAGVPLAEKMVKFVLGSLLHSFDWSLPEGEGVDLQDKFGIVVKKLKPLIIIPKPRLSKELY